MTAQRNQSLDVLRCMAVIGVLGCHVPFYRWWAYRGAAGVDLFFVLSGFLISGLLFRDYQKRGAIGWKTFLIRRGFKIYPAFYAFLAVTGAMEFLGHHAGAARTLLLNGSFVSDYFPDALHAPFGHLWSICIEEHFYILLPFLLILLSYRPKDRVDPFRAIPVLFVFVAAVSLICRVLGLQGEIAHADTLFAGVALGYLYHFRRPSFDRLTGHWALAAAMALIVPFLLLERDRQIVQTVGFTAMCLGFALLLAWAIGRRSDHPVIKAAAVVGSYSYSIYLWHGLLAMLFDSWGVTLPRFWLYVAVSLAFGIGMAKLVEMPALALREKLFPAEQRSSGRPASSGSRNPVVLAAVPAGGVE